MSGEVRVLTPAERVEMERDTLALHAEAAEALKDYRPKFRPRSTQTMPADPSVDLAALDALYQAATPGPLAVCENHDGDGWDVFSLNAGTVAYAMSAEDAALIAALHNAWPAIKRRLEIGDAAVEVANALEARRAWSDRDPDASELWEHRQEAERLDVELDAARARLRALREQSDAA